MESSIRGSMPALQKFWIWKHLGFWIKDAQPVFGFSKGQGPRGMKTLGLHIPSAHLHRQAGCRLAQCLA